MRIHLDGLTIQCLPGSLAHQANIDALILFVDTWLRPYGAQAEIAHDAGGHQMKGVCAEAAPMSLGRVAVTRGFGVPADNVLNCVVASADRPHPDHKLIYRCTVDALRNADEMGYHSVAVSPIGEFQDDDASTGSAVLDAVSAMAGTTRHLNAVRIIVSEEHPFDLVSMKMVRAASRLRPETGAK